MNLHLALAVGMVTGLCAVEGLAVPVEYTNEAEFLADLALLEGVDIYTEDFEGADWDAYRYPAALATNTISGVTWSGNAPLSTNTNWGRTGFGLFTIYVPPGSVDEINGDSTRVMYAVGGHFDSNADGADLWIEVDGVFGAEVIASWAFPFAGVIDPDGFTSFRIHDPDQEHVLGADDFTIAIAAEACLADLTGDGSLDFFDVSVFLSAFGAGDLGVDFSGDGLLDFFDVSMFLDLFSDGCP